MENQVALETFINQNAISMQLIKMEQDRVLSQPEGIDRYQCQLSRPGKQVIVYVSIPVEEGLTPSEVLLMLVLDASSCEMLKDYYGRHKLFESLVAGLDGDISYFEDFWQEYGYRCEQTEKLRNFLGKNLYNEIIDQFGFED